jgi:hypothetical protein
MTIISCNKCEREAQFDIPECLCARHWALWWTEEYEHDITPDEREKIMEEIISEMEIR